MKRHFVNLFGSTFLLLFVAVSPVPADPKSGPAEGEPSWSERFPEIAARIRHLDRRMAASDPKIRLRVLTELTYFRPRDSRVYPPFFRALLKDPSPEVRWEAVHRLWEHNQFLDKKDLPKSFTVPLVGELAWEDAREVARFRTVAGGRGPDGGWAIHALGIIGDKESVPLAKDLLDSDNSFTRFSAAVALIQLGEPKTGHDVLKKIAAADDAGDPSGFYRMRAAECLDRLGDTDAAEALISMLEAGGREGYADGPADVLEDLTDQWYPTPQEWRKWWDARKDKK